MCTGHGGKRLAVDGEGTETEQEGAQREILRRDSHAVHRSDPAAELQKTGQQRVGKLRRCCKAVNEHSGEHAADAELIQQSPQG